MKWLGERRGLFFIDLFAAITILAQLVVLRYEVLAAARLVLGVLLGISTAIIPVYLNSIAPVSISGKIGTFNQVFQTLGVLFAYVLGITLI